MVSIEWIRELLKQLSHAKLVPVEFFIIRKSPTHHTYIKGRRTPNCHISYLKGLALAYFWSLDGDLGGSLLLGGTGLSSPGLCLAHYLTDISYSCPPLTATPVIVVDTIVLVGCWLHLLSPSRTYCCHYMHFLDNLLWFTCITLR